MGIRYVCAGLGETGEVFVYLLTQICCRVNFPEQQGAQFRYTVPGKTNQPDGNSRIAPGCEVDGSSE